MKTIIKLKCFRYKINKVNIKYFQIKSFAIQLKTEHNKQRRKRKLFTMNYSHSHWQEVQISSFSGERIRKFFFEIWRKFSSKNVFFHFFVRSSDKHFVRPLWEDLNFSKFNFEMTSFKSYDYI